MKLIYFHGFGSSHASGTVETLRRELPNDEVVAPDIPVDPAEALPYLKELCEKEQPDMIVGTSMGGMYAQQMRGFKRILVNPAFTMSTNSKVLKTGIQHFNQMERQQFKDITEEEKQLCWCLVGLHDTTVTNAEALFKKNYLADHVIRFDGEHQLTEKVIKKVVLPLVEKLR